MQENCALKTLARKNKRHEKLLAFKKRYNIKSGIIADVISRKFDTHGHYFFVNKGKSDGIEKDTIAIFGVQLLGRVTKVYPWYAKVKLITDSSSRVSAFVGNNIVGMVRGDNSIRRCYLDFVNKALPIKKNDRVISSGQGLVFPEGFCLGKITKFSPQGLYHVIEITPLVDLQKIATCVLIKRGEKGII